MKKHFSALISLLFICYLVNAQEKRDTVAGNKKHLFFGFNAGPLFSKWVAGSPIDEDEIMGPMGGDTYNITYENKYKLGFTGGCFIEVPYSKHFSLHMDLNYYFTKHDIIYTEVGYKAGNNWINYADYTLSNSTIQFSILPKFTLGRQSRIYLLIGPYIGILTYSSQNGQIEDTGINWSPISGSTTPYDNFNTYNNAKGSINCPIIAMAGVGYNIPVNFKDILCFEMRAGHSLGNIVSYPNMTQNFIAINIAYQLSFHVKK